MQKAVGKTLRDKIRTEVTREKVGVRNSREFITLKNTPCQPWLATIKSKCHKITFVIVLFYLFVFVLIPKVLACESIRFSFALRRWGRPQRRRAKEKRMLSQATKVQDPF